MKEVSLSGSLRENVGKKDATAIRNAERVPAVIYGGKEQIHFSVKHTDLEKLVYTPNVYIINVELDGKNYKTIIQDLQQDPITDIMIHADFIELSDDKKVKVNVPVKLEGRAIGVMNGGKMRQIFRKLKVYAVPGELPDEIVIDVSKLRIGQAIRVRDLNNGLEILNPASAVICSIKTARGAVADEEEEEGGEEAAAEGAEEAAPAEESAE
ncbi:50S ribosomal protein L25/general stress protein Ctc [Paracrocinitomix mangrovi]|uniref:50S ribosomal protein L25/general stress protein Ctc n=1 Tax=Paracrocinitomix mangrovi TaxID=2862509 RepID=UPI001C8D5461|nr:50S ribosomal protein L25/general stress protein Ctc [Paracrocinitomix mangrovi]UKN00426.1 50S ribosomal protein L25/general stress protein Ctc [Paracrocinitomix mangrovi]